MLDSFLLPGRAVEWGGLASMAVFYGLIYVIGRRAARRQRVGSFSDLILAGRGIPLGLGVVTMTATWVGGGYINGTAEAAYASGVLHAQAPWGYGLSLIIGGLWFAPIMRRRGFTTMLDPLEDRFGRPAAAILSLPALTGEIFWTAAILTALGTTFRTILGIDFRAAILLSAAVAIAYTVAGGLWAVALTDVVQLAVLVFGLWFVVPMAASHVGGVAAVVAGDPVATDAAQAPVNWWAWWDSALLLIFGGVPWNVYFQRVLASRDASVARRMSVLAGALCMVAAVPPLLIGVVARQVDWASLGVAPPDPALILPAVLLHLTGPVVATLGLGALAAAVMSSVDSSILSASSMAASNVYRPFVRPPALRNSLAS